MIVEQRLELTGGEGAELVCGSLKCVGARCEEGNSSGILENCKGVWNSVQCRL